MDCEFGVSGHGGPEDGSVAMRSAEDLFVAGHIRWAVAAPTLRLHLPASRAPDLVRRRSLVSPVAA